MNVSMQVLLSLAVIGLALVGEVRRLPLWAADAYTVLVVIVCIWVIWGI